MQIVPYIFAIAASMIMVVQTAKKGPTNTAKKDRKVCKTDYDCGNYDKFYCSDKKKECYGLKKDGSDCTRDGQCRDHKCYRGTCTS